MYVANHASYLDIYSLFHLRRPFKFISKVSNFIIPIIGWSMYLTGHIALKRTDRKSQMKTLKDCRMLLQNDCSVLFFPEGTRSVDGTMADFKKGAFSVAAKENALVVPVTLVNCSKVMKNGREWAMRCAGRDQGRGAPAHPKHGRAGAVRQELQHHQGNPRAVLVGCYL